MTKKILITGAHGQLGKAFAQYYPDAFAASRKDLDITDIDQLRSFDWSDYEVIINCAAYVNADVSETIEGRRKAWKINAEGPKNLALIAQEYTLQIVHFSSEYVFDGTQQNHNEDEDLSPLSVYGQTKAAADLVLGLLPNSYILRTSWVVGDGRNFVKTMYDLAQSGINPAVVDDQLGRLTFVSELVRATDHLLSSSCEPGIYNLSNSGKIRSWAELAALTFKLAGHDPKRVKAISTSEYIKGREYFAPRPTYSDLDLSKIMRTGFSSVDYDLELNNYIKSLN